MAKSQAVSLLQSLGKTIAARRSELGLSQQELAYRAGVQRSYMSDIERGLRNLTLGSLENVAHALQTDASILLTEAQALTNVSEKKLKRP